MSEHQHGSEHCREIFSRLSEYLDEELDPAVCAAVEEHNADCAPCEAFLASLRKTVELIGDQEPVTLSEATRRAILSDYAAMRASLSGDSPDSD